MMLHHYLLMLPHVWHIQQYVCLHGPWNEIQGLEVEINMWSFFKYCCLVKRPLIRLNKFVFHTYFSLRIMLWTSYVLLFGNFCATCLGSPQYKQNLSCCQRCFDILNLIVLFSCLNLFFKKILKFYLRTKCLK
jgi:hypothetical protein